MKRYILYFNNDLSDRLLYNYGCNVLFISDYFYSIFCKDKETTHQRLKNLIDVYSNDKTELTHLYRFEYYISDSFIRKIQCIIDYLSNNCDYECYYSHTVSQIEEVTK